MRRGDVVLVADRGGGDYAGKPRPAVVVQSDLYDQTLSVVVCPLTSVRKDAGLLRVPLSPSDRLALRTPSWVMVDKLTSIRRDRVGGVIGRISDDEALALNRSLAVFLGFA
ncbi:type II toxin-antitoxin system PemK/MazF family toxin [Caldovatus aquaticus]|uniref:Type II toxin-antitoxin system PemK/MazF family toxin n=1 Tax=Caldovatus aquaticus TaxID=2865671 RepID=A0ABS7F8I7_9PROT|nr:type II toxin-antitoxin system PemK/MazF family toxin [Caldovatus aquaticus]MBW8271120.1 type II toxin-antitoxin system PemK/MazF family toxin [Caldovatus aquaticus]